MLENLSKLSASCHVPSGSRLTYTALFASVGPEAPVRVGLHRALDLRHLERQRRQKAGVRIAGTAEDSCADWTWSFYASSRP